MRIVILQSEVVVLEIEQALHGGIELHDRETARGARKLLARLVEVVEIKMRVAVGMHEVAGPESAYLRHHHREQRVRSDIERDAEKKVGAPLIELAGKPSAGNVELEERVAGQQRHLVEIPDVPGGNDEPP